VLKALFVHNALFAPVLRGDVHGVGKS